jgi:hypothetical protein
MVFKVFISSTQEDLKQYRQEARDAALKAGFMPVGLLDMAGNLRVVSG